MMGCGGGFAEGVSTAVVADLYSGPRRTAVMNYFQMGFAAGAVACPLTVGQLLKWNMDWRDSFVGVSAICLVGAVLTLVPATSGREKLIKSETQTGRWRALLADPLVLCLSLGIMMYVGSECGTANWLAAYFKQDLHATGVLAPLAPWSVSVFWFGIGVGRAIAAWASKHLSDYAVIRISLASAAVFVAVLLVQHHPPVALGVVFLVGLSLGPVWPTIVSRAAAAFPTQSGTVMGIVVAAGGLGGAFLAPSIGWIADSVGMRLALWACFAMLIINLALFTRLRTKH
jgi:fucose permease